jgi:putative ATP-dependent endonuclease of OLD family
MLLTKYGVSTQSPKFKGSSKWSDRLREAFKHQGKPWSDEIEARVKSAVADLVEVQPAAALNSHRRSSFDALVVAVEGKIATIAAGKK